MSKLVRVSHRLAPEGPNALAVDLTEPLNYTPLPADAGLSRWSTRTTVPNIPNHHPLRSFVKTVSLIRSSSIVTRLQQDLLRDSLW